VYDAKKSTNEPIQTSYPRAKIPYLSLLIILALINQPYLKSLPVTRASEVIVTSKVLRLSFGFDFPSNSFFAFF
jgi:hypothetical protein